MTTDAEGRGERAPVRGRGTRADRYRTAEIWRAVGVGLLAVWLVLLLLVVYWWVTSTFGTDPGVRPPGYVRVLGAPLALVASLLAVWTAGSAARLWRRRPAGWDPLIVLGAAALAAALYLWLPTRDLTPTVGGLLAVGGVSVLAAVLGERAWRRAA